MNSSFSKIPSVNLLLEKLAPLNIKIDQIFLKKIIELIISDLKREPKKYKLDIKSRDEITRFILNQVEQKVEQYLSPLIQKVINATGVILHTGLGRAPIGLNNLKYLESLAAYVNLEINLPDGKRGERLNHVIPLLRLLTGADDAVVVNNNAAAVLLALNTIANRREVIVSRGELVEIGGSFRMPEVMRISKAKMVEVGTTNKTHLSDYENAITERTAAILLVHTSNYKIMGFTDKPRIEDISAVAQKKGIPVIYDLGSGALIDMQKFGFDYEPVVGDILAGGIEIVTISGDKLLGGPQAGIILGKRDLLKRIRKNHLLRALRCDKLTLSLLTLNLQNYLHPESIFQTNDTIALLTRKRSELESLASQILSLIQPKIQKHIKIVEAEGRVGSGAYPIYPLSSVALKIIDCELSAEKLSRKMRANSTPIIGYIEENHYFLNLLAINSQEKQILANALNQIL